MEKSESRVFEYACHEGNYGLVGILSGAREREGRIKEVDTRAALALSHKEEPPELFSDIRDFASEPMTEPRWNRTERLPVWFRIGSARFRCGSAGKFRDKL
jgi:hypothetical protein